MKILLLGSTGLLGSTLAPYLNEHGHEVHTHGRSAPAHHQADITDRVETQRLLDRVQPEVVINLAAMTDVDLCERQPNAAYQLNVRAVENLAVCIKQTRSACHLLQISTDQVYDGKTVHHEDDVTLTNYYAFSKYAGELAAANINSAVLRTNFLGRSQCSKRKSLSDWIFNSLSEKTPIEVFDDVLFSPLSMLTLAETIELSVRRKLVGVFNLGSHGGMSKADFAFAFAAELGLPPALLRRTTTKQVAFLKTYRPKDMRMHSGKFEAAIGIELPQFKDEIARIAKEYL